MRKKHKIIGITVTVLLFFLVVYLQTKALNYRESVNVVKEGVIINLVTGTIVSNATLNIVGESVGFIERKFDGAIELRTFNNELMYLNGKTYVDIDFNRFKDRRISILYKERYKYRAFSALFTDLDFSNVVIQLNDTKEVSTDLFFVSELELNDAIQKSKELFKNTDYNGIY